MGSDISFDIPGGRGVLPTRGGGPGRSLFKDYQRIGHNGARNWDTEISIILKVVQISDERPPVSKSSPHH